MLWIHETGITMLVQIGSNSVTKKADFFFWGATKLFEPTPSHLSTHRPVLEV
jgi:hypothetical protein